MNKNTPGTMRSPSAGGAASAAAPAKRRGFGSMLLKKIQYHAVTLIITAVMMVGLALLAYPSFSDYWNSFHQSRAIMSYAETVAQMDTTKYEELLAAAEAYNAQLAERGISWDVASVEENSETYMSLLNLDGSGIMGYINIPKIDVQLPIYHGTGEAVLQTAIGHLEETSLPVGGEGSHCVVSGHRGLPSARLFSDLDKMKEGDTFTMSILNETLTYQVDQIRIVEPTDLSELTIREGQDLVTLVTCTPYGINTHRLLVRAHRIANASGEARVVADAIQIRPIYIAPFVAAPILVLLLILMLLMTGKKKKVKVTAADRYYRERHLERPEMEVTTEVGRTILEDPAQAIRAGAKFLERRMRRHKNRPAAGDKRSMAEGDIPAAEDETRKEHGDE